MANYRKPTQSDLVAVLSQGEVDAFRKSEHVDDGSDPVEKLLAAGTATVRAYLRANGRVTLSTDPSLLPESLIGPLCAYVAYDVLKRQNVPVGEDRRQARREALELFDKVARRAITPESDEEPGTGTALARPRFEDPPRRIL